MLGDVVGFDMGFSFPNLCIYIILNYCGESKNFLQSPQSFLSITIVEVNLVVIGVCVVAEPVANLPQVGSHAQVVDDNLSSAPARTVALVIEDEGRFHLIVIIDGVEGLLDVFNERFAISQG